MTNHTDKKLLELAAKAYGVEVDYRHGSDAFYYDDENTGREEWNPLDNDGQSLRLAVKLDISVIQDKENGCAIYLSGGDSVRVWSTDPYAATRRAIVIAAAVIRGKL